MADGSVIVEAILDTSKVTKGVGTLGKELEGISWKNIAAGDQKAQALAGALTNAGKAATVGLTLPIAAAGAAAVGMAAGFEDALAKVSTIADTTQVPMDDMRESILKLSDDTGIASAEIADSVYNAISAGQKTGDAVAFVGKSAKLAKAGFAESGAALDVLTTTLNAYSMSADQAGRVSDVLIMTQNKGKTTVGELSAQMGKAIPTASAFGMSLENLAAAYATTTAKGIATAESTTYINGMINELGDSGSVVGGIVKNKLGKSFADCMKDGMSLGGVLSIVQEEAAGSGKTMFDLFGSAEAAKAAFAIAGEGAEGFNTNLDAMNNSAGATDEAFEKMQTSSAKVEKAVNRVKNAAIDLGGQLLEALGPAIDNAGEMIEEATTWFKNLDDEGKNLVITIVGIVAAAGPLLTIAGSLVGNAHKLIGGVSGILKVLGPLAGASSTAAGEAATLAGAAGDAAAKSESLGDAAETAGGKAGRASGGIASFAAKAAILGASAYVAAEATRGMFSSNADAAGKFEEAAGRANEYAASLGTVDANADGVIDASDAVAQALDGSEKKLESGGKAMDGFVGWMGKVSDSSKGAAGVMNDYFGVTEDNVSHAMRNITLATQDGWGAALAATQSTGGEISDETKAQALAMCDAMGDLPPKYQAYGDEAMRALAASMAPYWPELADYSSMSAQQISQVIKDKMADHAGMQASGADAAQSWASGLSEGSQSALAAASTVTGKTIEQLNADCAFFGLEGDEAITAYASALANGQSQASAAAAAVGGSANVQLDASATQSGIEGGEAGQGYADALAAKREAAVAAALQVTGMTIEQFNASAAQAGIEGDEAVAAYANQVAAGQSQAQISGAFVASGATGGLGTGDGTTPGASLASNYVSAVGNSSGSARVQGSIVSSSAAGGMQSQNGNASGWGNHLVQNFASGIRGMVDWARSAASAVASAVAGILGHTIPKEGPLRNGGKGEKEWGEHAIKNFADGAYAALPELEGAMAEAAGIVERGMRIDAKAAGISFGAVSMAYSSPSPFGEEQNRRTANALPAQAVGGKSEANYYFTGDIIIKCDEMAQVYDMGQLAREIMKKGGLL